MQKTRLEKLHPGMILGEPIMNADGSVDLLAKGILLTQRHIDLLKRLDIESVFIAEPGELPEENREEVSSKRMVDLLEDPLVGVDESEISALLADVQSIEMQSFDYVSTSSCNKNLKISLLTGEGNIPLDVKHKAAIDETKAVFSKIQTDDRLDIETVRGVVQDILPDMVRNNDVLMRLQQLEKSDDCTFQHSLRVSMLASMIGKWLGYSKDELYAICEAGLLFDVGKLKVPQELLNKRGRLTPEEFEVVKKHAQLGYSLLLKTPGVEQNVKFAALQHHERMDGSGYPLRLQSGQIHEFAKIVMVCDIYDAMISDRNYRPRISPFEAAEYISWNSGGSLDSRICYIFLSNLAEYYLGKDCTLNNGDRGTIAYIDVNYPTKPVVKVGGRFVDLAKERKLNILELS